SSAAGRLEIVAAEGDTLPIGAVIARIGVAAQNSGQAGGSAGGGAAPVPVVVPESPSAAAAVQGAPPAVAAPAPVTGSVVELAEGAPELPPVVPDAAAV